MIQACDDVSRKGRPMSYTSHSAGTSPHQRSTIAEHFWIVGACTLQYTENNIWSQGQKGDPMRRLRESRLLVITLIFLVLFLYLIMWESIPLLRPYHDHPLVWLFLAFLSGGHLEELLYETESFL